MSVEIQFPLEFIEKSFALNFNQLNGIQYQSSEVSAGAEFGNILAGANSAGDPSRQPSSPDGGKSQA